MRNRTQGRSSFGFTLIEVMLTIALIALLGSIFVLNVGTLLKESEMESLENEYWRAVDAARTNAVFFQKPYFLDWDEKASSFVVSSGLEREVFALDTESMGVGRAEVVFEEIAPEQSYVLVAGELVQKRKIANVGFFPDGTCTPYTVSLKIAQYEMDFQMDPWTGARLVDPTEG